MIRNLGPRISAVVCSALAVVAMIGGADRAVAAPWLARQVGFNTLTFASTFTPSTVDMGYTFQSGFKWYPWNFWGARTPTTAIQLTASSTVTLYNNPQSLNGAITSAASSPRSPYFVGTAFGGGAYFEAKLKFDPSQVVASNFAGWPSWWSMTLEHLALGKEQWQNAPAGYLHFAEADFMEYDLPANGGNQLYGGNMHDWSGVYNKTCTGQAFCDNHPPYSAFAKFLPAGTDLTQWHTYGYLWVPATATSAGYAKYYFDRVQVGPAICWNQYNAQSIPAATQMSPWLYGVLDTQHLVLILGTGKAPMTVEYVDVWQASAAQNMTN